MCYPKPGPRCSSHAKKSLNKAVTDLKDFRKTNDITSIKNDADVRNKYFKLQQTAQKASDDYDMTVDGIKKLQKQFTTDPTDDNAAKLFDAETKRELALDLLKSADKGDNQQGDHQDDDTSAVLLINQPPAVFGAERVEHPEHGTFIRSDKYFGPDGDAYTDIYNIRIEADKDISDEDINRLAGMTGYSYRRLGAERIGLPERDSSRSFVVYADTTKSGSDDIGVALHDFSQSLPGIVKEGSQLRKTNKSGPGTANTRLIDGFGDDLKIHIYFN